MLKSSLTYSFLCDGCGVDAFEDCMFSGWGDIRYAFEEAQELGWITDEDEKHFCPHCHEYDDDDNLVFKTKFKKIEDMLPPKKVDILGVDEKGNKHYIFRCACSNENCTEWRCSLTGYAVITNIIEWDYLKEPIDFRENTK